MFNKLDEKAIAKTKSKIDAILSDKQKKEIYDKIKEIDKDQLMKMINNIDANSITEDKLDSFLKDLSANTIINKLDDLK